MTEHESEKLKSLCARISEENNPVLFSQLLVELDVLLRKLSARNDLIRTPLRGKDDLRRPQS